MTKIELAARISRRMNGVDQPEASRFIEHFMAEVKAAVTRGERVDLRGFGGFAPVVRKAKVGRILTPRNGGTTVPVNIPARTIPAFRPAEAWMDEVTAASHARSGHPREGGDLDQRSGGQAQSATTHSTTSAHF